MKKSHVLCLPLVLLAGSSLCAIHAQDTLREAITGGTPSLNLRYRFETVDSDLPGQEHKALASTLRTAFGYRTAEYRNLQAYFEFEDTANAWDDLFNSTANGKTDYPVVADPSGSAVNQAYLDYHFSETTSVRAGRQELILDNARFLGNVGWRQNHLSLDSVRVSEKSMDGVDLTYAYVHSAQTITGVTLEAQSHLLHGSFDLGSEQSLSAYYYHLDIEDAPAVSSATAGLRFTGSSKLNASTHLAYVAEYAKQKDVADNPNGVSADYYLVSLAPKFNSVGFELAIEHLGGSGSSGDKFTTPLATGHKFNGFADQFLTVPDSGLDDLYFGVGGMLGGMQCRLTYHMFQSDAGSIDYGNELDATLSKRLNADTVFGIKLAAFSADDAGTGFEDVSKLMIWTSYSIL